VTDRRSEDLGFKALTRANWRDPDPTSEQFMRPTTAAGMVQMTGTDWARHILEKRLDAGVVPLDVIRAFEIVAGPPLSVRL
jgi:hypothetical protein